MGSTGRGLVHMSCQLRFPVRSAILGTSGEVEIDSRTVRRCVPRIFALSASYQQLAMGISLVEACRSKHH